MFKFLKKNELQDNNLELLSKTASLLIHAAKIDEKYTNKEKELIKKTLIRLGANENKFNEILQEAEINEEKEFSKDAKLGDEYIVDVEQGEWNDTKGDYDRVYKLYDKFIYMHVVNRVRTEFGQG